MAEKRDIMEKELTEKTTRIKRMAEEIRNLKIENTDLNEKVFDLGQKISQWELYMEERLQAM
jgi:predicted nuclease with TOPRIM domain